MFRFFLQFLDPASSSAILTAIKGSYSNLSVLKLLNNQLIPLSFELWRTALQLLRSFLSPYSRIGLFKFPLFPCRPLFLFLDWNISLSLSQRALEEVTVLCQLLPSLPLLECFEFELIRSSSFFCIHNAAMQLLLPFFLLFTDWNRWFSAAFSSSLSSDSLPALSAVLPSITFPPRTRYPPHLRLRTISVRVSRCHYSRILSFDISAFTFCFSRPTDIRLSLSPPAFFCSFFTCSICLFLCSICSRQAAIRTRTRDDYYPDYDDSVLLDVSWFKFLVDWSFSYSPWCIFLSELYSCRRFDMIALQFFQILLLHQSLRHLSIRIPFSRAGQDYLRSMTLTKFIRHLRQLPNLRSLRIWLSNSLSSSFLTQLLSLPRLRNSSFMKQQFVQETFDEGYGSVRARIATSTSSANSPSSSS